METEVICRYVLCVGVEGERLLLGNKRSGFLRLTVVFFWVPGTEGKSEVTGGVEVSKGSLSEARGWWARGKERRGRRMKEPGRYLDGRWDWGLISCWKSCGGMTTHKARQTRETRETKREGAGKAENGEKGAKTIGMKIGKCDSPFAPVRSTERYTKGLSRARTGLVVRLALGRDE